MGTDTDGTTIGQQRELKLNEMAVRLLGIIAIKDFPQTQQIATLNRVGFTPKEVAEMLGTTPNTVRVALVDIRKAEKQGRRFGLRRQEDKNE
jgi:hypothetical protein